MLGFILLFLYGFTYFYKIFSLRLTVRSVALRHTTADKRFRSCRAPSKLLVSLTTSFIRISSAQFGLARKVFIDINFNIINMSQKIKYLLFFAIIIILGMGVYFLYNHFPM